MVFGGKAANYAVPIVVGTQTLGLLKARLRDTPHSLPLPLPASSVN